MIENIQQTAILFFLVLSLIPVVTRGYNPSDKELLTWGISYLISGLTLFLSIIWRIWA